MFKIYITHKPNINAIDLNLLKVFSALASERSATKAAKSVGLSQSAVRHALRRLREMMDDELFIRAADGMQPTERCRVPAPAVNASLKLLQDALTVKNDDDPAKLRATFRLGMNDLFSTLLVPGLSMEQFTALGHIMFTTRDSEYGRIDDALSKMGIRRRIELRVPRYSAALSATAQTDLVYTMPRVLASHAKQAFGLEMSELPFEAPVRKIFQVWHKTRTKEFGHKWSRSVVADMAGRAGIASMQ